MAQAKLSSLKKKLAKLELRESRASERAKVRKTRMSVLRKRIASLAK